MSERAYNILERAYKKSGPWINTELGREDVPWPTFRAVNLIEKGGKPVGGYTDVEKRMVTLSAGEMDRLLGEEYPEPFVENLAVSAFFHELKHYKDLMKMTSEERAEFRRKYVEDPLYNHEFEQRALDYGIKWARTLR